MNRETRRSAPMIKEVPVRPKCRFIERKLAAVSPTVVPITLIIQKIIVISGTLL
jgi:hypothetical protein